MGLIFHRRGYANNSSSTHSIITLSQKDSDVIDSDENEGDTSFGWGDFVLQSKKQKLIYFLTQIKSQVINWKTPEYVETGFISHIVNKFASKIISDPIELSDIRVTLESSNIDHQSIITFPVSHEFAEFKNGGVSNSELFDEEFFFDLLEFVCNENNLTVFGGNDNQEYNISDKYQDDAESWVKELFSFIDKGYQGTTSIYDEDSESWTLYNKSTGSELCFSFTDRDTKVSSIPTLIDLKITDYCEHGCRHCYQSSTTNGKHMESHLITSLVNNLKRLGTGTIAIGGGNPLLHPDIERIVTEFSRKTTTCLTCNSIRNANEFEILIKIIDKVDSIAITCNNYYEVEKTVAPFKVAKQIYKGRAKLYIQGILEMFKAEGALVEYLKCVKATGIRNVTLLGFKPVGRGENDKTISDVTYDWIKVCNDSGLNIGIDADISKRYSKLIKSHKIDGLYLTEEGNRSMFIDAVKSKGFPDSYSDHDGVEINLGNYNPHEKIKEIYNNFKV
jgi:MoaA/NifB/PqqE/SkfB family radical SAM enzyme